MAARASLSTEELQREATKAFLGEAASKVTFAPTRGGAWRERCGFRRRSAGDCPRNVACDAIAATRQRARKRR